MTTFSEPGEPLAEFATNRRLHPWSWLFELIEQLKSFALPLIILLVGGSRDSGNNWEFYGLIGAGFLILRSIALYFTYRFGIDEEGLQIRSGLFQRTVRRIPFDRIQNVSLQRSILHRLFGVAEVKIESAGGTQAEAQMRVLRLDDAVALEALIKEQGQESRPDEAVQSQSETRLLRLALPEVVRIGLISNKGMVVVAAAIGLVYQMGDGVRRLIGEIYSQILGVIRTSIGVAELNGDNWPQVLLGALILIALAVIVLRIFSVLLAITQFYDFQLIQRGRRLIVERGLFTRLRGSLPSKRIQAFSLRETLLHRWFKRQSLRVDRTSLDQAQDGKSIREIVPIATPDYMQSLIARLLPVGAWPSADWHKLHPRAWRRLFTRPSMIVVAATAIIHIFFNEWFTVFGEPIFAPLLLLLVPILYLRARIWAKHAAYTMNDSIIGVRTGWLDRNWRIAEVRKIQAVRITQSPFDRRHGMATLWLDTIGANPMEPALRIPFLHQHVASDLAEKISARITG